MMIARLGGGTSYSGNFDVPEAVHKEIKAEMDRLVKENPGLKFQQGEIHTHDRGHRLIEYTAVSSRHDTSKIADYLDSYGFHLYAKYRGEDASRWPVLTLEAGKGSEA